MKTLVCWVCAYNTDPDVIRCGRCGWELRDPEFLGSLKGLEEQRYLQRRDLARARWKKFRGYDQSPRRRSLTAYGRIALGATSSQPVAIGGRLL